MKPTPKTETAKTKPTDELNDLFHTHFEQLDEVERLITELAMLRYDYEVITMMAHGEFPELGYEDKLSVGSFLIRQNSRLSDIIMFFSDTAKEMRENHKAIKNAVRKDGT